MLIGIPNTPDRPLHQLTPPSPITNELRKIRLFLGGSLGVSLISDSLSPGTSVLLLTPGDPELPELGSRLSLLLGGDLALGDSLCVWGNWEGSVEVVLGSGGELLGGGVSVLELSELPWEKDELALVGSKTFNVLGKTWNVAVDTAVVDGNTNGASEGRWNLGSLKLLKGETTASTDTTVVLLCWAPHNWSELVDRARGDGSSLCDSGISSAKLASGLVKVRADTGLPLLPEVVVGDLLIVLDCHFVRCAGVS
jgi:hypothetical protein